MRVIGALIIWRVLWALAVWAVRLAAHHSMTVAGAISAVR
jgi:hypothetical protein